MQVVGANKGGVVAVVEGLRGFVPFSQLSTVSSLTLLFSKSLVSLILMLLSKSLHSVMW